MGVDSGDEATSAGSSSAVADESPGSETEDEPAVSDDEQTWGVLVHVSALAGLFVPFGNILGPLIVWLVKKDESRFVDENGKRALNFQVTWTVIMFVALLSILVGVGLLVAPVVALAWIVLVVIATVRASEKQVYDYPLTVDLVA